MKGLRLKSFFRNYVKPAIVGSCVGIASFFAYKQYHTNPEQYTLETVGQAIVNGFSTLQNWLKGQKAIIVGKIGKIF